MPMPAPPPHLTFVAQGRTVGWCEQAARVLQRLGVCAELADLSGRPAADEAALLAAVQRSGRLACVVEEGPLGRVAIGLAARTAERAALLRPVLRVVVPAGKLPPVDLLVQAVVTLVAGPRARHHRPPA
jgi:pyruvate/2-oxoglutarate/acetoin dehydrogenase E1 component